MTIKGIIINHDCHDYMIAEKPVGMPCQDDSTRDASLISILSPHFSKTLHLINRLDRPCGGLVLLAKSKRTANTLMQASRDRKIEKLYLAIVEGSVEKDSQQLDHHIVPNKKLRKAYVSETFSEYSKPCSLNYAVLQRWDRYSLVAVKLLTGRFHQVRAQLSHIGHPVKGDVKYGARRRNKDRHIDLMSHSLIFVDDNKKFLIKSYPSNDSLWEMVDRDLDMNTYF